MTFNVSPQLPKLDNFGFLEESQLQLAMNYQFWQTMISGTVLAFLWCFIFGLFDFFSPTPYTSNFLKIIQSYLTDEIGMLVGVLAALIIFCLPVLIWSYYCHAKQKKAYHNGLSYQSAITQAQDEATSIQATAYDQLTSALAEENNIACVSDKLKRVLIPRAKSHFDNQAHAKFWGAIDEIQNMLFVSQQSIKSFNKSIEFYFDSLNGRIHSFPLLNIKDTESRTILIQESFDLVELIVNDALANDDFVQAYQSRYPNIQLENVTSNLHNINNELTIQINNLSNVMQINFVPSKMSPDEAQKTVTRSISNILLMSGR